MTGYTQKLKLKNVLKGLTPTLDYFDNNPTDLENATDGDYTSVTGTGDKVLGGAGNIGAFIYDLGSPKLILLNGRAGFWATSGSTSVLIDAGITNQSYDTGYGLFAKSGTSENIYQFHKTVYGRYIRVRFSLSAAGTGNVRLYQVMGHEIEGV